MVTRADILKYAARKYHTESEHLWEKYPNYEILRHRHNGKWYAAIMDVPKNKLGLAGDDVVDIVDVKAESALVASLSEQPGFCHGYHMNKEHWLSIILDGTVRDEEIYCLLDGSYELTE